ncbi:MAG: 16S rRNA (guanine(966)-N(2))-methyltransferase RsmD, partial [Actinomycetota bacterium]
VRPVSDRAREGLFSSLAADVPGANVLDLFAGTGALGIEALSRGAERAVFVERDRGALRGLRENLERTRLADRAEVVASEVLRLVTGNGESGRAFDVVLADPPYDAPTGDVDALLEGLAQGWLELGGAVVLTRRSKSSTPVIPVDWRLAKRLEYGDTALLIFREV